MILPFSNAHDVWEWISHHAKWLVSVLSNWDVRSGIWWIIILSFSVFSYCVLKFRKQLSKRKDWKGAAVLLGSVLGTAALTPPSAIAISRIVAWLKKQQSPLEVSLADFIAVLGIWGVIFATAISNVLESESLPPTSAVEPPPTDSFIVIRNEDDLLKLDQSRFLESGFGGLLPGKKRKT